MPEREGVQERTPVEFIKEFFHGKKVLDGFAIRVDVSPARSVEQAHFVLRLVKPENGELSLDPVFSGLFSAGRPSQYIQGWIDGDYFETATFPTETRLALSESGLDGELFTMLGELVPPGGSLMVSYSLFSKESYAHRETKLGLDRGYPPVVAPLGFLLFRAGCGMGFKD